MSYFTTRSGRIVAGTLAGALALSVTPILGLVGIAGAADALPPVADPIGAGNFCENASATEPFTDVSDADPSQAEIACLVDAGITTGTTATTYSPNGSVTRRQMALFIKRLADMANAEDTGTNIAALPADDGVEDFDDTSGESAAVKTAIDQLVNADIVNGITADTYGPGENVSRRQMAAFVNRLQEFLTGTAFTTTGDFFDDDNGDSGEDNLNAVASVGIFQGDGAGNVFPGSDLTRRQMANILLRDAEVNFEAGDIDSPFEPATNQGLSVTPADAATLEVSTGATNNTGARTFTASGLDNSKTYDVSLMPAENITNTGGTVTFASNAAVTAAGGTSIETVNGAVITAAAAGVGTTAVNNVTPVGGQIIVAIDSVVADRVILVVSGDTDNDNTLDLTASAPTEPFGIGGETEWYPAEGASGLFGVTDVTLTRVNKTAGFISNGTATWFYDANDTYQIATVAAAGNDASVCVQTTQANFLANLSVGDEVDRSSTYNADPSFTSVICIEDLTPGTPGAQAATASGSSITSTWTAPASTANSYNVYRAIDPTPANSCAAGADLPTTAFSKVGSATALTFTEAGAPNGTHCVQITAVLDGDESALAANTGAQVVTPTADAVAPTVVTNGAVQDVDGSALDVLDAGDVFKLYFSEAMAIAGNSQLYLSDGVDTGILTNGGNATFALNAAADAGSAINTVLTVTVNSTVLESPSNDVVGAGSYTITNRVAITDTATNAWALGGDVTAEDNGAEFFIEDCAIAGTTCTVTFNEAVGTSANTPANWGFVDLSGGGVTLTSAVLNANGRSVALTFSGALGAGDTIAPSTGIVDTDAQAATQGATAIA